MNLSAHKKPPIGVVPKYLHDSIRQGSLAEAIKRYVEAKIQIPIEWVEEYNEISERYKQC